MFQFHKVRLKAKHSSLTGAFTSFQFHKVRLKEVNSILFPIHIGVSIP